MWDFIPRSDGGERKKIVILRLGVSFSIMTASVFCGKGGELILMYTNSHALCFTVGLAFSSATSKKHATPVPALEGLLTSRLFRKHIMRRRNGLIFTSVQIS